MVKKLEDYTQEEIDLEMDHINHLTHEEMARLWRYGEGGHPYFNVKLPFFPIFKRRFDAFGGITAEMSKKIRD